MIITPGYQFTDEEKITAAKLNELGTPTVELEPGDVDEDDLDIESVRTALGDGAAHPNYWRNGLFGEPYWSRGNSAVGCPVGEVTYRADWWWCRPEYVASGGGGAISAVVSYSREQTGPDIRALHSARLVGETGIQIVDFGQDIKGHLAAALRVPLMVSFHLYNGTGASLTPTVRIETADAFNNFSSTTFRGSATGTAIANATWSRQTIAIDPTAYTNMINGARIFIRIPTTALNDAAKFVRIALGKVERGTVATLFVPERDEVTESESTESTENIARNFLSNPVFAFHRWRAATTASVENVDTYGPDEWFTKAAGAAGVSIERVADDTASGQSPHVARLTGAAGVSTVDFGQNLEPTITGSLQTDVVFSIWIYNDTGVAFVPLFRVDTCDAALNFDAINNRINQTLDNCPEGAWTRVSYSFDPASVTNFIDNGTRLYVRVPAGSLDDAGKNVLLSQPVLEFGTAATSYEAPVQIRTNPAPLTQAKQLILYNSTATVLTATATDVLLLAPDGSTMRTGSLSETIDSAGSGAGGLDTGAVANDWYYVWVISNGDTVAGLLSLSSSAPTMPAGYRFKGLIGVARYQGGAWRDFKQLGNRGVQNREFWVSAAAAAADTWEAGNATLVAKAIPPNAVAIGGSIAATTDANWAAGVGAKNDNNWGLYASNRSGTVQHPTGFYGGQGYWLPLFGFQSVFFRCSDNTTVLKVDCLHYELHA